jgi:hypothetical protein
MPESNQHATNKKLKQKVGGKKRSQSISPPRGSHTRHRSWRTDKSPLWERHCCRDSWCCCNWAAPAPTNCPLSRTIPWSLLLRSRPLWTTKKARNPMKISNLCDRARSTKNQSLGIPKTVKPTDQEKNVHMRFMIIFNYDYLVVREWWY